MGNISSKKLFVVLDETGEPEYVASWPLACHEHINDAINEHKLDEARKWVVREVVVITAPETSALHASAPHGHRCADCSIDGEACPVCYEIWWCARHAGVPSRTREEVERHALELRKTGVKLRDAEETAARIPPREFDIESHTGLYTELPLPVKASGLQNVTIAHTQDEHGNCLVCKTNPCRNT